MAMSLKKGGLMAEINVTPFVDVMLVLLIIFMVTAPMLTQGLEVDLPQTRSVDVLPTDSDHLVLTIGSDGSMTLDEYAVNMEGLAAQVKQNVVAKHKQLFLQADKTTPYGIVVQAMGEIKEAGVDRLGVVAEKVESPDQGASAPAGSPTAKTTAPAVSPPPGKK